MEYKCEYCNKTYSSRQSRWNHVNKYHNDKVVINNTTVVNNVVQNVVKKNNNSITEIKEKPKANNICKYCNKEFCDRMYRWKHEKKCKLENKQTPDKINKLEKDNEEIKKENEEMKKQMQELKDLIQKSMKIHPKTLQKINNQLNNNGVINNYVVQLGYEDFDKVLSEKEKIGLLNKHSNSVVEMVKMVHINPNEKYKQYKSMYITNLQNNVAYKYDDDCKKFIAVSKSDLLESIIDNRLADIESFHEDYKDKITPFTSKHIQKFIERMSNEKEYKDVKKEELKFAIYNGREEIIQQIKENNPDLNIFT
jgi:hypothetical protein